MRRAATGWVAVLAVVAGCSAGTSTPSTESSTRSARPADSPTPSAGDTATVAVTPARLRVHPLPWRLPRPLAREALASSGPSSVLVAGGLLAGDRSSASTYTLRLRDGAVSRRPDLTAEVHDTAGVVLAGKALVLGGGNAVEQSVVQSRSRSRGPWQVRGRLPTARSDLSAVVERGEAYVVGGYDGTSVALGDVLASRAGRHWRVAARLPVPVRYAATVATPGAIWVFGGERAGAMVDDVQRIDLHTGQARVVAHLPVPLGHSVAVRLGRRMLVAGGRTSANTLTGHLRWFRPGHGFTPAGALPTPLADSAAVAGGPGTAYLVGGETPGFSDQVVRLSYR